MCDEESQADELLALENIYTQEEFKSLKENGQLGGHFLAFVVLENGLKLIFKDLREPESCYQELLLDHLPPLSLLFSFPKDYPSSSPPEFTLSCQWLRGNDIRKLCRKLDKIWDENKGMEIMYIWTQFLKEESLKFLGMDKVLDISKMYTFYLSYVEYVSKRNKGLMRRGWQSYSSSSTVQVPIQQAAAQVPIEQTAAQGEGGEVAVSEGDKDCGQQPELSTCKDCGAEEDLCCNGGPSSSVVKSADENKSVESVVQKSCTNVKPLEQNRANNANRRFSKERQTGSKENRYHGRRYRLNSELKNGKNKQNEDSQTKVETPKDCNEESVCEATCSMSRLELKDTENESLKNGEGNCKYNRRGSSNHVRGAKFNNRVRSGSGQAAVNKLNKTDTKSEPASVKASAHPTRGKGLPGQHRNVRRPRNETTEQEKETKQSQAKNKRFDNRAIVDLSPQTSVIQHLVDYNNRQRELQFERSMHTCKVCFEDKLGVYCMKFDPCRHVFCSDCITSYFEVRIMEGTVLSIPCPEDKCPSEAQPSHVRALVSPEMYTKYDSILLSAVLDTQPDMMYCPRRQCRYPVFHEDKTDKLATCPECKYAFCVLCEKVYHGVAPCVIVPEEKRKLMHDYLKASEEEKRKMEAKYGKQQLKNLVDTFHLEWSETWIKKNSKKCPHCCAAIEKSSGCNKMLCWKCDTLFCWLCNMKLDKLKPYNHFNDKSSPCFNNLFQGVLNEVLDEDFDFDEEFIE